MVTALSKSYLKYVLKNLVFFQKAKSHPIPLEEMSGDPKEETQGHGHAGFWRLEKGAPSSKQTKHLPCQGIWSKEQRGGWILILWLSGTADNLEHPHVIAPD